MYNKYFGLPEAPFSVTPDPRFFYTNPVYQEAFAILQYGIEAKKGFIVITGEVGTGKTTLLRKLLRNLQDTIDSVFVFNTLLNFTELLQVILHELGLRSDEANKVVMLQELNDYLIKQLRQGRTVSVLIDEAQNLSDETLEGLRLLSNLETDEEKLLQIVLMGQPELNTRLDQPTLRQLKQRVAYHCRLAPLKPEEVGQYIEFRLRAAGYQGKHLFRPDAVRQIAFYSKCIPRLINIICDNALLTAYAESRKFVSGEIIAEVGRDLRLEPEAQVAEAAPVPPVIPSTTRSTRRIHEPINGVPQQKSNWRRGLGAMLAVLVFVAMVSIIDPQHVLSVAAKQLELSKYNLKQWIVLITRQPTVPAEATTHQQAMPEVVKTEATAPSQSGPEKVDAVKTPIRKHRRVTIRHGSTVHEIASDVYGANTLLGLDLIKEFNPQIDNLNWIFPGQTLLLPSLTQETMLRKQSDGSYRLLVAAFPNTTEAEKYGRLLGNEGYRIKITPKRVADNLVLHRVEIDGLKNLEEADQLWATAVKNQWFAFVELQGTATR